MDQGSEASQTQEQPRKLWTALIEHRFAWLAGWDSLSWVAAIWLATWVRYEFDVPAYAVAGVWKAIPVVVAVQLAAGFWQGLYRGRWHLGSFEEIAALLKAVVLSALVLFAIDLPLRWVPISVPVAARVHRPREHGRRCATRWRLVIERRKRPSDEGTARVLVFGAGDGAQQVITAMLRDPDSPYLPVAIVDDDPRKAQLRIRGVPVCGTQGRHPRGGRRQATPRCC